MSKDENQRQPGGPLAAAVSQASGVIATALTEYLGRTLQAAGYRGVDAIAGGLGGDSRGESASDSISSVFTQYRDALGDLAAVLPQVVQRASREWRVEPGMRLIFRARVSGTAKLMPAQEKAVAALHDAVVHHLLEEVGGQRKKYRDLSLMARSLKKRIRLLEEAIVASMSSSRFIPKWRSARMNGLAQLQSRLHSIEAQLREFQPPNDWQHVFATKATLDAITESVWSARARASHPGANALATKVDTATPPSWPEVRRLLELIGKLFSEKGRTDLPDVLDMWKHEIRDDPVKGLAGLRVKLDWMLDDDTGYCHLLLQTLDQSLGAAAVGEILHRKGLFEKFVATLEAVQTGVQPPSPPWEALLRKAFAAIGYPLGGALTILAQNTRERSEFMLLDHAHNRMFGIREGELGFDTKSGREIEIYALREGRTYFTGKDPKAPPVAPNHPSPMPRTLPHRIHDAAVGMAVWTVDRREVQAILDSDPQRPPVRLRAWDMGANRTPLVLFVVHYRESDITEPGGGYPADGPRDRTNDEHYELGLGCFVAPRNDPLAMGMMVLGALPVSMPKAVEVGREIWGYDKVHISAGDWDVRYRPDVMTCVVKLPHGLTLRVQLPRGGSRSSSRIPLFSYTMKFGQLHRNVLTRSGSGETLRVGGHGVEVSVTGVTDWWKKNGVGGNCRSLLTLLYQFGIARDESPKGRRASYSLWTEHLQGEQGPPCLVAATFDREDE